MNQPPLPQPELDPKGITGDQYMEYTPEKLELSQGFYEYGGQDFTAFYLAILRNMGLRRAVQYGELSLWLQAIAVRMRQHPKLTTDGVMADRLEQSLAELETVIQFLESS